MSAIRIERTHNRGLDAAKQEAESLAEDLTEKFGLKYGWQGETLAFKGSGAKGEIHCASDS
ncbi:polyhydroxyalkanoic acid system family protein, partial [Oleiphilus sp. HI0066]|uniref:polyhydroxyalkanoic acid system family protein n=2 Tax=Oleiphilus TaxID=141450 RepID=UPI0007C32A21